MALALSATDLVADEPAPITVVVEVQSAGVRDRVRQALALSGTRMYEAAPGCPANVVLVEGGLRRGEIARCFEAARARWGTTPIIGVWPDDEPLEERLALRAGVSGLILESEIETCLLAAAQATCSGQVCLPRQVSPWEKASMLSAREKEVLSMLIVGSTNAQIGRKLYLAESTVKSHVSSAYVKLGVRSRKDAVALLVECEDALGLDRAAAS